MSNGAPGGLEASPEAEMKAFDSLDQATRDLLNYASLDYSALQLARAPPAVTTSHGITITRPHSRETIIAAIQDQERPIKPVVSTPGKMTARVTRASAKAVRRPTLLESRKASDVPAPFF